MHPSTPLKCPPTTTPPVRPADRIGYRNVCGDGNGGSFFGSCVTFVDSFAVRAMAEAIAVAVASDWV